MSTSTDLYEVSRLLPLYTCSFTHSHPVAGFVMSLVGTAWFVLCCVAWYFDPYNPHVSDVHMMAVWHLLASCLHLTSAHFVFILSIVPNALYTLDLCLFHAHDEHLATYFIHQASATLTSIRTIAQSPVLDTRPRGAVGCVSPPQLRAWLRAATDS